MGLTGAAAVTTRHREPSASIPASPHQVFAFVHNHFAVLIAHEPIVDAAASGYPSNCTARRGLTDIRAGHRGRAHFRCARPELMAMIYAQITNVTRRCPFPKSRSNVCARPPRVLCIKRPHSDGAFRSNAFPRGARALVVLVESRCA